jgi:hypothetical protein
MCDNDSKYTLLAESGNKLYTRRTVRHTPTAPCKMARMQDSSLNKLAYMLLFRSSVTPLVCWTLDAEYKPISLEMYAYCKDSDLFGVLGSRNFQKRVQIST